MCCRVNVLFLLSRLRLNAQRQRAGLQYNPNYTIHLPTPTQTQLNG